MRRRGVIAADERMRRSCDACTRAYIRTCVYIRTCANQRAGCARTDRNYCACCVDCHCDTRDSTAHAQTYHRRHDYHHTRLDSRAHRW
jgi:hypothetical protein